MLFQFLFKNKRKKNLFIHIPKTGGSTFVGLLKESVKLNSKDKNKPTHIIETIGNTEIKHVDFSKVDRKFKSPEIFEHRNYNHYKKNYNLFMIVRNPVDRLKSEFNFQYHILKGKDGNPNAAIISRLRSKPKSLSDYILNPETQNYQCKFLLGRTIADSNPVTDLEFQRIIDAIDSLPIHCGITNNYEDFLNTFQTLSGIKLNSNIVVRKKTPKKLNSKVSIPLSKKILELNAYDYKLYLYVKQTITDINTKNNDVFKFNKDKDYVI